jgi:hypothetical protein
MSSFMLSGTRSDNDWARSAAPVSSARPPMIRGAVGLRRIRLRAPRRTSASASVPLHRWSTTYPTSVAATARNANPTYQW